VQEVRLVVLPLAGSAVDDDYLEAIERRGLARDRADLAGDECERGERGNAPLQETHRGPITEGPAGRGQIHPGARSVLAR